MLRIKESPLVVSCTNYWKPFPPVRCIAFLQFSATFMTALSKLLPSCGWTVISWYLSRSWFYFRLFAADQYLKQNGWTTYLRIAVPMGTTGHVVNMRVVVGCHGSNQSRIGRQTPVWRQAEEKWIQPIDKTSWKHVRFIKSRSWIASNKYNWCSKWLTYAIAIIGLYW